MFGFSISGFKFFVILEFRVLGFTAHNFRFIFNVVTKHCDNVYTVPREGGALQCDTSVVEISW